MKNGMKCVCVCVILWNVMVSYIYDNMNGYIYIIIWNQFSDKLEWAYFETTRIWNRILDSRQWGVF